MKIKILKNHFEKKAWADDLLTCGLDEVGRGCLAGPLVVAAVIVPQNTTYALLKDSKLLDEEERNKAFAWIIKNCYWSTGIASNHVVDKINISQATLYAMKKAYMQLIETLPLSHEKIKYVLVDAMPLSIARSYMHKSLECYHFPKGERLSCSIAAASIVAKVTRDRLMQSTINGYFPAFGFDHHKGYATKQHITALQTQGASVIHRTTFIGAIRTNFEEQKDSQKSIFGDT